MFSGIIEELGEVKSISKRAGITLLEIAAKQTLSDVKIGDSIAVNGVCLTVTKIDSKAFVFEVMPETLRITNLGLLRISNKINLERGLKIGDRLSGHFVTGHIDCLGLIRKKGYKQGNIGMEVAIPAAFSKFCLSKGSIALDGISLTIAEKKSNSITVYIIPHTLKLATLGFKNPSDRVNIEFDIFAKKGLTHHIKILRTGLISAILIEVMANKFIGTSGWNYPHWKGVFYPADLAKRLWLQHYVKFFNCVELNVTFYRLVPKKTFQAWKNKTPDNFYFVAKGSRFITHIKKLHDVKKSLNLFFKNAAGLKKKLAAVLWQLPPNFKKDTGRLESFLKLLKKNSVRQAFEFRNKTWFDREVYDLLKKFKACLCIADSPSFPCVKEITADFLYLRFHGGISLYSSNYSSKKLKQWADFAKFSQKKDIFAFFNNDAAGFAVKNALKFKEFLKDY